jgi:hypothetical protein
MVRRDAAPDVPRGKREAECTGGAEWTEAGHGRMLVVVPVVVLAAGAVVVSVLVSVPVVVPAPVVVPVPVTPVVSVPVAVAVLLLTRRRPFGGLRLLVVTVSVTVTMVGPRGFRRRGGWWRGRCGRGGRGRGRADGSRAHRPPRGGRARGNRHVRRHRCKDRSRDEAWDRRRRRRNPARRLLRKRGRVDDSRACRARSQRKPRRPGLPVVDDELRQLERSQTSRGEGRQHYHDRDYFPHKIPSNCRSTLALYRRGAVGT